MVKLILSVDGGGIRGAAAAEFLKQLESKMDKPIHETFDMFVGTSTGGIIAAAIGVLQMNADSLSGLYGYENANTIMEKSYWDRRLGLAQNQPKYDGKGKRSVLKKYFGDKTLNSAKKPTLVVAYDLEARRSAVLKSTAKEKISALDAVDASSAAPLYFPTVKVNKRWMIDGGVIANNPTMCAYAEAKQMWPDSELKILSVGTGSNTRKIDGKESRDYGGVEWITHDLLGLVMDESIVAYQIKTILGDNYVRVNSRLEYANDDMDDCSRGNIDNLRRLGREWFQEFGKQAKQLIGTQS